MPKQATTQSDAVKNRSRSPLMLLIAAGVGVGLLIILLSLLLWRTPRPDIARTDISPPQAAVSSAQVDPDAIQSPSSLLPSSAASAGVDVAAAQNGETLFTPQTFSLESNSTFSVAWGDYNNDGNLDLAVGSYNAVLVYTNENGKLISNPVWSSGKAESTRAVAWGDYDGDGWLDLAVGNGCYSDVELDTCTIPTTLAPSRIYRNNHGIMSATPVWSSTFTDKTKSIAWGDYDGDGDLDIFMGNLGHDRLYRNDGVESNNITPTFTLAWTSAFTDDTRSIALGDYDYDGDLDLAAGNGGIHTSDTSGFQPDLLYRNNCLPQDSPLSVDCTQSSDLIFTPVWTQADLRLTTSVAWGDYDGDGWLDLAIGNIYTPTLLYRNVYSATGGQTPLIFDQAVGPPNQTQSMAWGDYDGDGDLDLAVGKYVNSSQLYRNDISGTSSLSRTFTLVWQSPNNLVDGVFGLAWGDIDNDGDLDLAAGNNGVNRIYYNNSATLLSQPQWTTPKVISNYTHVIAWGDYDSDGYQDLAVGNSCQGETTTAPCYPDQVLHYNGLASDGVTPIFSPVWTSTITDYTLGLAWGDVDGDGWLDLAVGNYKEPNRLYSNINGILETTPSWSSAVLTDPTTSLAWGDVNGDGWLDLAVGNGCILSGNNNCDDSYNRLYRNINGALETTPSWSLSNPEYPTTDLAWGDYDGDSDLDLVIAAAVAKIYRNDTGILTTVPIWSSPFSAGATSVAWGDYDGDGDLDLAISAYFSPSRLYRNDGLLADGVTPKFTDVWQSVEVDTTGEIVWSDYDNDGDLDLGVSAGVDRIYRNDNGALTSNAIWQTSGPGGYMAWGDYDGDGDLDLAASIGYGPFSPPGFNVKMFHNTRDIQFTPSPIPIIHLTPPGLPATNANFYSTAKIWSDPIIPISYTLIHPHSQPVRQIIGQYSLNGGGNWQPAVPTNTRTISLTTSPGGAVHTYTWDVLNSGVLGQSDNVVFRLVAIPAISNTVNAIPGPYLYGSYAAQTFPFRVRGSQVQVYSGTVALGNEVAGALVYRLPAGSPTGIFEPYTDLTGQPFRTDNQGYLQGRGAIAPGDQLVALLPITWTDHYTVYYTSAAPTPDGINTNPVPSQLGVQNLVVSAANPLILFNLDISLEWDARNDAAFLRQLERDLNRASQILYDLSNGQMALGKVRVFQAKENWLFADVLIYASNRVRPNADLGGIVNVAGDDELAKNQGILASAYLPGQVRIGPTWTRFGNASDSLGDDWPRALAHELGHYLLYLQDNYLGVEDDFLVDADCQGSAMTDPYRVDYSEFLTRSTAWQETCANTVTARTTGRPDWETIAKFYRWLDPNKANEGPNTLPLHLTKVDFSEPASGRLPRTLAAPFFGLLDENGQPLQSRQIEGYLIKSRLITGLIEGVPVSDVITYVTAVGSADPGLIHARGAEPEDRLCVFDYSVSPMRLGCQKVGQAEATVRLHRVEDWPPQITVTPVDSQTFIITATTKLTVSPALSVQIFSDYGPPSFVKPMQPVVSTDPQVTSAEIITFTETLTTAQPTFSGFVWLSQPGSGGEPEREILVEFALGGDWPGPSIPGYIRGPGGFGGRYYGRPFVWRRVPPRLAWFRPYAPINSGDGQVTIVNIENPLAGNERYSLQTLATPPNLPLWLTPVGQAYRFSTEQTATVQNSISFQYLEQDVPAKQEDALRIYHSPDEGQTWCRLETKVFSYRNRASAKMPNNYKLCNDDLGNGEGIYVLVSTVEIPTFSQGWNNFGYTVPISRSVITALASIDGQYTSIYHYNANTKLWKLFDPTIPSEFDNLLRVNDLTDLEFGQGYWINIVTQTTLYLAVAEAGRLDVKTQEDLQALIAAAQAENIPIPPALYYGLISTTLSVNTDTKIIARVGGQDCGEATLTKTPVNQWIYKLQVKSADELTPCGAPDRTIKFEIDGQELAHDQLWNNGQAHALDLSRLRGAPPTPTSTPTSPSPVTPTPPTPITPTPTPTSPSPTTPPPTICSNNLLINSTMDRDEGWALDLGAVPAQYVSDPRGSGRSLFVGLPYNRRWGYRLWSSARQTVTIPAGQSVTLALKYLLNIEPRSGWDDQFIAILDRYNRVSKLWNISRSDNGQWRDFSQDISEYAGQTVQVYAGVTNDGFEGVTSMLVDDVSLCIR